MNTTFHKRIHASIQPVPSQTGMFLHQHTWAETALWEPGPGAARPVERIAGSRRKAGWACVLWITLCPTLLRGSGDLVACAWMLTDVMWMKTTS